MWYLAEYKAFSTQKNQLDDNGTYLCANRNNPAERKDYCRKKGIMKDYNLIKG